VNLTALTPVGLAGGDIEASDMALKSDCFISEVKKPVT